MIAVCSKPAGVERGTDRRRPGRPSSRSAPRCRRPARAWLTAVSASRTSAASLSTDPSAASGPQWPWSVYSHRQVSAIVDERQVAAPGSGGTPPGRCRRRPMPRNRAGPSPSGRPNRMTPPTPRSGQTRGLFGRDVRRQPATGRASNRSARGRPTPGATNSGRDEHRGMEPRLADQRAQGGRAPQPAGSDEQRSPAEPVGAGEGGASRSSVMRSPAAGGPGRAAVASASAAASGRRRTRGPGTLPRGPSSAVSGPMQTDGIEVDVDRFALPQGDQASDRRAAREHARLDRSLPSGRGEGADAKPREPRASGMRRRRRPRRRGPAARRPDPRRRDRRGRRGRARRAGRAVRPPSRWQRLRLGWNRDLDALVLQHVVVSRCRWPPRTETPSSVGTRSAALMIARAPFALVMTTQV